MDIGDPTGLAANLPYFAMAGAMAAFALWIAASGRASIARSRALTAERALGDVGGSLRAIRARRAAIRAAE